MAFLPLVLLHSFFGFPLKNSKRNKMFRLLYLSALLATLFLMSGFIQDGDEGNVVVATIAYINSRCIYFTLIIIYIRNVLARKSLREVFKRFDNIDLRLQTTFGIKIKENDSKWFIRIMLLLLFISASCSFVFQCLNSKMFNVGHFIHAMLVFILSVKILFYCMLCASIKVRFKTLIKYLNSSKSTEAMLVARKTKYVAAKSIVSVSQVKEISLIYDEVLEIILLLNESFSALLSAAFGKMVKTCDDGVLRHIIYDWMNRFVWVVAIKIPMFYELSRKAMKTEAISWNCGCRLILNPLKHPHEPCFYIITTFSRLSVNSNSDS